MVSKRATFTIIGTFLLFFLLAAGLQWHNGAYNAELGRQPDEAAHFVTGLMVLDYLTTLSPLNPMAYAEQYYVHYPKVAMGHWPPFFYVVEAVWLFVFPASQMTALLLMAFCCALLTTMVSLAAAREYGLPAGIGVGVVVTFLYWIQYLTGRVTPDMLVAALTVGAALIYAAYLENPGWRLSLAFALVASAACLTKGTGFVLAMVPPVGVLLTRRFGLLKTLWFWLPAAVVPALCAPWYLMAPSGLHQAAISEQEVFLYRSSTAAIWILPRLANSVGEPIAALAALGVLVILLRALLGRNPVRARWVVMAGVIAGYWVMCILASPTRDVKNTSICGAPLAMLASVGVAWFLSLGFVRKLGKPVLTVALCLCLGFYIERQAKPVKSLADRGYREAAADLLSQPGFENSALLVASDSSGEGAMVAQIAMRERRPGTYVLRGSKVLASAGWFGQGFQLRYEAPDDLMRFLDSVPVTTLVVDSAIERRTSYHELLAETIKKYPERWQALNRYPKGRPNSEAGGGLTVYRLTGTPTRAVGNIRIDMRSSLGRVLSGEP